MHVDGDHAHSGVEVPMQVEVLSAGRAVAGASTNTVEIALFFLTKRRAEYLLHFRSTSILQTPLEGSSSREGGRS